MTTHRATGWAVEITPHSSIPYDPYEKAKYLKPYFVGRLSGNRGFIIPDTLSGYLTAVYRTRKQAFEHSKDYRRFTTRGDRWDCVLYKRVRIVRVEVLIQEIPKVSSGDV